MASRYYGLDKGQNEGDVAEGAATNTVDIEVVVDLDTNNPSKQDVILALDKIKNHLIKSNWPPA